jgi:hypothetical protein
MVSDSDYRFFPPVRDDTFGYVLHPVDLAMNKVMAGGPFRRICPADSRSINCSTGDPPSGNQNLAPQALGAGVAPAFHNSRLPGFPEKEFTTATA